MTAVRAGVTDNFIAAAAESSYGNAATTFARVVPARNDSWAPNIQEVDTDAFRPNRQTMTADQTTQVPAGGTGSVEMLVPNSGNFLFLRDMLDEWDATLDNVTNASSLRKLTLKSNGAGPNPTAARSLSYLVGRVDQDGARRAKVYAGCVLTDWELSCAVGEPLTMTANYDWNASAYQTPSSAGSYTAPALTSPVKGPFYTWRDVKVSINNTEIPVITSLSVTGTRGLDTELFKLQGQTSKTQPSRSAVPTYAVTLECRYDANTASLIQRWGVDGTTGAIVITATGREDKKSSSSTPIYTSLEVKFANAKVIGNEPVAALSGMSTISLALSPIDIYNGSSTAVQIEAVGAQTAIN